MLIAPWRKIKIFFNFNITEPLELTNMIIQGELVQASIASPVYKTIAIAET